MTVWPLSFKPNYFPCCQHPPIMELFDVFSKAPEEFSASILLYPKGN